MPEMQESNVMTTKKVEEIQEKEKYALKLKRTEILWHSRNRGVRKGGVSFAMTKAEREEYIKCKLSVFYFAQKYCKIKREDGTIGEITLRRYQKEIIKLFNDNRYSILMASRQTGKCSSPFTTVSILDEITNDIHDIPFYDIYYQLIKSERKLLPIEKIKYFLYNLYSKI